MRTLLVIGAVMLLSLAAKAQTRECTEDAQGKRHCHVVGGGESGSGSVSVPDHHSGGSHSGSGHHGGDDDDWGRDPWDHDHGGCVGSCGGTVYVSCAPEVAEANVKVTERILNDLTARPEFANAAQFKAEIANMQTLPQEQKIPKYFGVMGIDSSNQTDVLNFIGAREIDQKVIDNASKNLSLTNEQAKILAVELQSGLLGSLSN
jgi:hypothetical protein